MVSEDKTRITITIDKDLAEQIDFYCDNLNFKRSQFVELILGLNLAGIGYTLAEKETDTMEGLKEAVNKNLAKDKAVMKSLQGLIKAVDKSVGKKEKNGKR